MPNDAVPTSVTKPRGSRTDPDRHRLPFSVILMTTLALAACAGADSEGGVPTGRPEVFAPGVISDGREQYRVTFTPTGDTAYFAASDGFFPQTREASIYYSVRVDGAWQPPALAPFSGTFPDLDPFVTPEGTQLYFSSIRPHDGADRDVADLWVVEREGEDWGVPVRVETSTEVDDLYPSLDRAGNLYFANPTSTPDGSDNWNIVVSRRTGPGLAVAEPIAGKVNSDRMWEFNPAISPDGRRLVFTRLDVANAVETGFGQLHVSILEGDGWGEPRMLDISVNSGLDEYHPSFSPGGETLYFVRRDPLAPDADGDLYRISVGAAGLAIVR